jgi:hypothetical protein
VVSVSAGAANRLLPAFGVIRLKMRLAGGLLPYRTTGPWRVVHGGHRVRSLRPALTTDTEHQPLTPNHCRRDFVGGKSAQVSLWEHVDG